VLGYIRSLADETGVIEHAVYQKGILSLMGQHYINLSGKATVIFAFSIPRQ
jgi:hypothetical protein